MHKDSIRIYTKDPTESAECLSGFYLESYKEYKWFLLREISGGIQCGVSVRGLYLDSMR